MNTHRSSRGFTLIEMLVIFAIIMAIAVASFPMMAEAIEGSKLRSITQGTVSLMRLARLEAIRHNACGRVELDTTRRQVSSYLDQDCNTATGNRLLGTLGFPAGVDVTKNPDEDVVFLGSGSVEDDSIPTRTVSFVNRRGTTKEISVARTTGKISIE